MKINNFVKWVAEQKLYFDQGFVFFPPLQLMILVAAAYPTLSKYIPLSFPVMVITMPPLGVLGVWAMGKLMVKVGFLKHYKSHENDNNELLQKAAEK